MIRRRGLEQSFALSTALLVILVIGMTVLVVHTRVEVLLLDELEARAYSIARSIGAVSTPSLLAYNYAALQMAAEGAVEDDDLVYVVLHDKEGATAGSAQSVRLASTLPSLRVPVEHPISHRVVLVDEDGFDVHVLEVVVPVRVEGVQAPWGMVRLGLGHERQIR